MVSHSSGVLPVGLRSCHFHRYLCAQQEETGETVKRFEQRIFISFKRKTLTFFHISNFAQKSLVVLTTYNSEHTRRYWLNLEDGHTFSLTDYLPIHVCARLFIVPS